MLVFQSFDVDVSDIHIFKNKASVREGQKSAIVRMYWSRQYRRSICVEECYLYLLIWLIAAWLARWSRSKHYCLDCGIIDVKRQVDTSRRLRNLYRKTTYVSSPSANVLFEGRCAPVAYAIAQ